MPSPPATKTFMRFGATRTLHWRAEAGFRSARSITWAGFRNFLNSERMRAPSLLPDFLLPERKECVKTKEKEKILNSEDFKQ